MARVRTRSWKVSLGGILYCTAWDVYTGAVRQVSRSRVLLRVTPLHKVPAPLRTRRAGTVAHVPNEQDNVAKLEGMRPKPTRPSRPASVLLHVSRSGRSTSCWQMRHGRSCSAAAASSHFRSC